MAFFANITKANCLDYGLTNFADTSSSLSVIHTKIEEKKYSSIEEFLYDFKLMVVNILTYYPEDHEAKKEAINLSHRFDQKWQLVCKKFV